MNSTFSKQPATCFVMPLTALLLAVTASWPAHAVEAAGAAQSGGLYSAALYVDGKPPPYNTAVAGSAPRQLRLTMLRSADTSEIADMLARSLSVTASDEELFRLVPAVFGMGEILGEQKTLAAGEALHIDWAAATGTTVSFQTKTTPLGASQSFEQSGMFDVITRSWLARPVGGVKGS